MRTLQYPARFRREGRFVEVYLPRIGPFGTTTQGVDLDEARVMASDALTVMLEEIYGERGVYPEPPDHLPIARDGESWAWVAPEVHVTLAWQVRTLREARGWTQQEAAEKLGLSATTYSRWENPRTCNPTVRTLRRIAELHGQRLAITLGSAPSVRRSSAGRQRRSVPATPASR